MSLPRVRRGEGRPVKKRAKARGGQVRDLPAQGRRAAQAVFVEVDGGRREELGGLAAVLAPGAVAAGVGELLAEVRREDGGLAAVVGGEGQHLVEPGDLPGLPLERALVEGTAPGHPDRPAGAASDRGGAGPRRGPPAVPARPGSRGPAPGGRGALQGLGRRFEVEAEPDLGLLGLPEEAAQKIAPLAREAVEDLVEGTSGLNSYSA